MSNEPLSSPPASLDPAAPSGRVGFAGLLRSEWTKLTTVRSTLWTLGATVVLALGIGALATKETRTHWSSMNILERITFDPTRLSLVGTFFAQLSLGVLGVLVIGAEYGTGTIRATFAAEPRRPRVLVAKIVVFGVVVFVLGEILAFAAFFLGQSLLGAPAVHATLSTPGAARAVVGAGLFLGVMGEIGLALATLIRHSAGAISTYVGILLVLPIIIAALPDSMQNDVVRFLPSRIGEELVSQQGGAHVFAPWTGFAVLVGYGVVLFVAATVLLLRRDA